MVALLEFLTLSGNAGCAYKHGLILTGKSVNITNTDSQEGLEKRLGKKHYPTQTAPGRVPYERIKVR